jgi:hypothetical protein
LIDLALLLLTAFQEQPGQSVSGYFNLVHLAVEIAPSALIAKSL